MVDCAVVEPVGVTLVAAFGAPLEASICKVGVSVPLQVPLRTMPTVELLLARTETHCPVAVMVFVAEGFCACAKPQPIQKRKKSLAIRISDLLGSHICTA